MTINLIGTGNVAWHLANQLAKIPECTLQQIARRSLEKGEEFKHLAEEITTITSLKPATITIIAVSDTSIENVAALIPYQDTLVVHTSGSITLETIPKDRKGVFYPLQSFSKNDMIDFTNIPICIEATTKEDLDILQKLATLFSTKVYQIDSHRRKQAHLAAVFVNNFANHCYTIAQELCNTHQIPFELLHALLEKTAQKAIDHSPSDVQTGPAKRNDTNVIKGHIDMLKEDDHKSIYQTLTASIIAHYGKEL